MYLESYVVSGGNQLVGTIPASLGMIRDLELLWLGR